MNIEAQRLLQEALATIPEIRAGRVHDPLERIQEKIELALAELNKGPRIAMDVGGASVETITKVLVSLSELSVAAGGPALKYEVVDQNLEGRYFEILWNGKVHGVTDGTHLINAIRDESTEVGEITKEEFGQYIGRDSFSRTPAGYFVTENYPTPRSEKRFKVSIKESVDFTTL